jgi:hypothetical protein
MSAVATILLAYRKRNTFNLRFRDKTNASPHANSRPLR